MKMSDSLFFLFGGDHYYPSGGMRDLVGAFPTAESALEHATGNVQRPWDEDGETSILEWWHIATVKDGDLYIIHTGSGSEVTR
jgi:hypothetical protein